MEEYQYIGEIQFEQKSRVEQIRCAFYHELSSHAFASLYLWKNYMGLKLYLGENFFTVKCDSRGKNVWFFPCGEEDKKRKFLERHLDEEGFSLCYLRDEDKVFLEQFFPGYFQIDLEEGASEYLYDRGEYETISGGKFSNMRKQIKRLQKEHKIEVQKLCEENIDLAREILYRDMQAPGKMHSSVIKIVDVVEDALQNRNELELDGILVFVDCLAQSLVLGFPLTRDTVDGCLECSNTTVRGLSYFAKRAFFLSSEKQYRYMNAEEDLGLPGLRMAKRKMAPVCQNIVWNACNIRR